MKKKYLIGLLMATSLLSACSKQETQVERLDCKELSGAFDRAAHNYLISCMKSCFRVTFINAKKQENKENFKEQCEIGCRDAIPYSEINLFKKYLNENLNCNFDYSKKMANPPTKKDVEN